MSRGEQTQKQGVHRAALSSADAAGTVYFSSNDADPVYRAIGTKQAQHVKQLFDCGLVSVLASKGLIPGIKISEGCLGEYAMVLEQDRISPVIYPYEWSPEMLRAAALCVLDVNEAANAFGYELKDAHPYNIVFDCGKPVFVDIGSLQQRRSTEVWAAEEEFVDCYCRPLALIQRGLIDLYRRVFFLRGKMESVDLAVTACRIYGLLGVRVTRWIFKLFWRYKRSSLLSRERIERHVKYTRLAETIVKAFASKHWPFRCPNIGLLRKRIRSYRLMTHSMWSDYHQTSGFYDTSGELRLPLRMQWIVQTVESFAPASILELAGNQGVLSRALAQLSSTRRVICADYDLHAVDQLFLRVNAEDEKIHMACFNFMGDVCESLTGERARRLRSEMLIVLAVTHHLLLTQNHSLQSVLEVLAAHTSKFIIIEFMPLGLWDGENAPPVPDWYNEAWFLQIFEKFFIVLNRVQLEPNRIAFVGELQNAYKESTHFMNTCASGSLSE
ncbi:MAG: hypothetical protein LBE33_11070 [Zoogloeaceae bacterium]|jgi:hypothetical protein|nr:hypothetical protein [Zoogloeaceae bacterium]